MQLWIVFICCACIRLGSVAITWRIWVYSTYYNSHKIRYVKISNNKDLNLKIKKVLSDNKPVICELMIDPDQEQMPKAINKRMPDGKSVATTYEDMYPFLSSKEIKENML